MKGYALPPVPGEMPNVQPVTEPGGVRFAPAGTGQMQPQPAAVPMPQPMPNMTPTQANPLAPKTNTSSVDMILKRLLAPGRGRSMLPNYY